MPSSILWLGIAELVLLLAAVPIAVVIRFGLESVDRLEDPVVLVNAVLFSVIMILANSAMGVYANGFRHGLGVMTVRSVVAFCLLGVLVLTLIYYVIPGLYLGRGIIANATICGMLFVAIARLIFFAFKGRGASGLRLLVIGAGDRAAALDRHLAARPDAAKIVGYVNVSGYVNPTLEHKVLKRDRLSALVAKYRADEVVVAMDGRRTSDGGQMPLKELFECKIKGTRVNEAIGVYERELGILEFTELKQGWMVFSNGFGGGRLWDSVKRFSDVLIATILIIILWPLMLLAALFILLETGRPILYRQVRIGLNGREFEILKFRSMTVNAEADGQALFAKENDSRVTKVGAFIRNTRIDELPQLYNVLRGDMSFVGPRPERPEFVNGFEEELPFYAERHVVKPGLMGWAQLNYPYGSSKEDAANKLRYDLYYVKNRSLILDLVIIVQTVQVVLLGSGVR